MGELPQDQWWYIPTQQARTGPGADQSCNVATLQRQGKRDPRNPSNKQDNFPLPYNIRSSGTSMIDEFPLMCRRILWPLGHLHVCRTRRAFNF